MTAEPEVSQLESASELVFQMAIEGKSAIQIAELLKTTPEVIGRLLDRRMTRAGQMAVDARVVSARLDRLMIKTNELIEDPSVKPFTKAHLIDTAIKIEALRINLLGLAVPVAQSQNITLQIEGVNPEDMR